MFYEISPYEIQDNVFKAIDKDWMLITAAKDGRPNSMTASWGSLGILWNKPIAICFVRPQRYTYEFCENADTLSLTFFDEQWRDALKICGRKSGRDIDKAAQCGLTPVFVDGGVTFEQAEYTIVCRKMASQFFDPAGFVDSSIENNYANKDYHKMYIGEIIKVYKK